MLCLDVVPGCCAWMLYLDVVPGFVPWCCSLMLFSLHAPDLFGVPPLLSVPLTILPNDND